MNEAPNGEVTVRWSDGVNCMFLPTRSWGRPVTCWATETCRHLVRTVLAYQRRSSADVGAPSRTGGRVGPGPDQR